MGQPPVTPAPLSARLSVSDPHNLIARLTAVPREVAPADDPRWYALALRAQRMRTTGSFDRLLAVTALDDLVQLYPYQLRVVEQVLREKAPAAILADDTGLGKTAEAALIYKELALRGIVRSALILTPTALLAQWQEELRERFREDFVLTDEHRFRGFASEPRVICSIAQFVRAFDRIATRTWDLLIVDEAHLLANLTSKRRQAVRALGARWRLLLTATPVANKLTDVYSLVDIVAPGRLGTPREFEREFVADPGTARVLRPERAPQLRAIVRDVMCRTRRAETDIAFAGRTVETQSVHASGAEDAMISDVTDYLRAIYRRGTAASHANRSAVIREIMALQQSLSSSPRAIERSLRDRAERHPSERSLLLALADRCAAIVGAKEQVLLDVLARITTEPALIFTLRLETATRLRDVITARGRPAACYVGALDRHERDKLVHAFNAGALETLIATDAGAEGLNLHERCHIVVNYDLHWNPMRMEQRIGRVHRLGQTRDVLVLNMVLRDTIDDYVLQLLYQKINLFTMTIGALETVLAELQEGEADLEQRILEVLLSAPNRAALRSSVHDLGGQLVHARDRQHAAESLTVEALG